MDLSESQPRILKVGGGPSGRSDSLQNPLEPVRFSFRFIGLWEQGF